MLHYWFFVSSFLRAPLGLPLNIFFTISKHKRLGRLQTPGLAPVADIFSIFSGNRNIRALNNTTAQSSALLPIPWTQGRSQDFWFWGANLGGSLSQHFFKKKSACATGSFDWSNTIY